MECKTGRFVRMWLFRGGWLLPQRIRPPNLQRHHAQYIANVFFIFRKQNIKHDEENEVSKNKQINNGYIFYRAIFSLSIKTIWKRNRLKIQNEKTLGFNRWNEIAHKLLN